MVTATVVFLWFQNGKMWAHFKVGSLIYESDCKNHVRLMCKLCNAYENGEYAPMVTVEIFLEYDGLNLAMPKNHLDGNYISENTGLRWVEKRSDITGLTYTLGDLTHPFSRSPEWLNSEKAYPSGDVYLTGR